MNRILNEAGLTNVQMTFQGEIRIILHLKQFAVANSLFSVSHILHSSLLSVHISSEDLRGMPVKVR